MKNCTKCIHAVWDRTKSGSRHPSGDGQCGKIVSFPELPACRSYLVGAPVVVGGYINRNRPLRRDCVYYSEGEK